MLSFSERLFIRLYYDPEEGALIGLNDSSSDLIAAGGLAVNLLLDGRIRFEANQLTIVDSRPTQDYLSDEALARLASLGPINREDPLWFSQIAERLPMGNRLFNQLMEKLVIHRQEKKVLMGLSKIVTYPFHNPAVRETLFEPERAAMLHAANPDKYTASVIFMAYCWGAARPWKLSRNENNLYEKRWQSIFGDYWGWYGKTDPIEPIKGMTANLRYAIADLTISWASVHVL